MFKAAPPTLTVVNGGSSGSAATREKFETGVEIFCEAYFWMTAPTDRAIIINPGRKGPDQRSLIRSLDGRRTIRPSFSEMKREEMIMKKLILIFGLSLALCMVLIAGCSDDAAQTPSGSAPAAGEPAATDSDTAATKDEATDAEEAIGGAASDLTDQADEGAAKVEDETGGMTETLKGAATKVKDTASEAVEDVKDVAKDVADGAKDAAQRAGDALKDAADKITGDSGQESVPPAEKTTEGEPAKTE